MRGWVGLRCRWGYCSVAAGVVGDATCARLLGDGLFGLLF